MARQLFHKILLISSVACAVCVFADRSYAQSFLFPGASTTVESGLSQTNSRGSVAVVNNPANTLVTKEFEVYADLNIMNLNYAYTRPGYSPATISLTAPPVDFGMSYKPRSNFALGLFVTPRPALSEQAVKNVPESLSGAVVLVDVASKQGSIITGFGGAYRVNHRLLLGLSIIETVEDSQIIVRKAGTTDDKSALLGMRYQGSFLQFMAGFRVVAATPFTIAGSFKTSVAKSYTGTQIIEGDQDNNVQKKSYSPSVLALGAEYRFELPSIFGEVRREAWGAGRSSYSSGIPGSATSTDLNDIYILVMGGRLKFDREQSISASFGLYPPNCGMGSTVEDSKIDGGVSGVQFGEFDNLDRKIAAAGYRYSGERINLNTGLSYLTGSRTVSDVYSGYGTYTISVLTLATGLSVYF